ncbi:MAG: PRC-barrel domain-containing protein [Pseudolabrys sp.]|nr:PRC-barrel domain-containing protein [Pseudolabrys sp.]
MMKRSLTAAALAVVLAAPAFAQTATPPAAATTTPATTSSTATPAVSGDKFVATQATTDWRASKLIGATVYGSDNASIGEVNDVILASDGKVNGVVIGVGGFLGVGEKNVAVSFDKLTVNRKPDSAAIDKITVAFSKEELKGAPTFAYYDPAPKPATTGSATGERPRGMAPMGGAGAPAPSAPAK